MKRPHVAPKVLLAEGKDERWVLPELLEGGGVPWPDRTPPVWIEETNGVESLLAPSVIETELKASALEVLGIVVDANGDLAARWKHVCARLTAIAPTFPQALDPVGVIHEEAGRPRIGVWVMPDNVGRGMLETLLLRIRAGDGELYDHARDAVGAARTKGAPFLDAHRDKAELHTWLAWQDPPGQQLHAAVRAHALDAGSPLAAPFVAWFRRLFDV